MMTMVIPIAMMAKKVTFRVVLKRFRGVSKLSVTIERASEASNPPIAEQGWTMPLRTDVASRASASRLSTGYAASRER